MFTLRTASAEEQPWVQQIIEATAFEQLQAWRWDEATRAHLLPMQYEALRRGLAGTYPKAEMLIIEVAGERAGLLILDRGAWFWRVIDITVLPQLRGQGLGAAVLQHVIAQAAEAEKPVSLQVGNFNPARRLYDRLGFQVVQQDAVAVEMLRPCPARTSASAG